MKLAAKLSKWLIALFVGAIIILLGVQIYNYFFVTVKTEYAIAGSMEDSFSVSGILCRNETVLKNTSSGYYDVIRFEGEKVASSGKIALVYSKESDVKAQEQIRSLKAQIDEYTAAGSAKTSFSGDTSAYDQSVQNAALDLSKGLFRHDTPAASEALESFEKNVYIKEIVSGETNDYTEIISKLQSKITQLESSLSGNVNSVTSSCAGYYSKHSDGLESKLTLGALTDYSIPDFNKLYLDISKQKDNDDNSLGKIVSDYKWQYYFTTAKSNLNGYSVGKKMSIRFSSVSDDCLDGTIISMTTEGDNTLVGVECVAIQPELLSEREIDAEIITKTYSGIRVDKNSVRIVDGQNGVYVKVGSIIKFKKVTVLYMGTTYALIKSNEYGGVTNFDQIVIGGKNIYDGKVLS